MSFLLRKIPLPYPHLCYVLREQRPTRIFLKEIFLLVNYLLRKYGLRMRHLPSSLL